MWETMYFLNGRRVTSSTFYRYEQAMHESSLHPGVAYVRETEQDYIHKGTRSWSDMKDGIRRDFMEMTFERNPKLSD